MGGGRAVFGVLLGIAIVAAAVFAGSRWLPKPEKKIEWVHSDASVIVQMKTSGADGVMRPLLPVLTLYGDGTLIVTGGPERCGTTFFMCEHAEQSRLSEDEVSSLLRFITDKGFFNFSYAQPQPRVSGAGTTYIYAAAKETQNAVSANALGFDTTEDKETDWSQFRKLADIGIRLKTLRDDAVVNGASFAPEEGLLYIQPIVVDDNIGVLTWPYSQIDIAAAAPTRDSGEHRLSHDQLLQLQLQDTAATTCWCQTQYNSRAFNVYYRPLLPHEDNFPEFEPPQ